MKNLPSITKAVSAREASYLAVAQAIKEQDYVAHSLQLWREAKHPSEQEQTLAYHIAFGAMQMAKSLDYYAEKLSSGKKKLKANELALLRCSLYQCLYLDRLPLYAVADEMVKLAKKYCHNFFAAYINAILRRLPGACLSLPEGDTIESIAIRYSYPEWFVSKLVKVYGLDKAKDILSLGNTPAKAMAKWRCGLEKKPANLQWLLENVALIPSHEIKNYSNSSDWYLQNATPIILMQKLAAQENFLPRAILDVCSSPGGKLLSLSEKFSQAKLFANDISEIKLAKLRENLQKYNISAELSQQAGEEYQSAGQEKYDLIVIDAPCSNSGVLNKRPEARWRLDPQKMQEQKVLQEKLLKHSCELLESGSQLWYLTCSILPEENEQLTGKFCEQYGFKKIGEYMQLPNEEGFDGGYACALQRL